MNKILIENDKIIDSYLENIECTYSQKEDIFDISKIILNIKNDANLKMKINMEEESKLIIEINIIKDASLKLNIITEGNIGKIQYKYNLDKKSKCIVEKYNHIETIREMVIANLDEESDFEYTFKSIATNKENYDYMIYHNGINSISDIKNSSVNESGIVYFQISSFIPKKITGCSANQFNRIINLTDNKCEIKPILYIDCDDVVANHAALIDKFRKDEIFYLESKGIKYDDAIKLLTKGFLLANMQDDEIIDMINKRYGGE